MLTVLMSEGGYSRTFDVSEFDQKALIYEQLAPSTTNTASYSQRLKIFVSAVQFCPCPPKKHSQTLAFYLRKSHSASQVRHR